MKSPRVLPVFAPNVAAIWSTATIKCNAKDYKAADSNNLDDGENKLRFTIRLNSEKIYADDNGEEDGNPGSRGDV